MVDENGTLTEWRGNVHQVKAEEEEGDVTDTRNCSAFNVEAFVGP